MCPSNVCTTAKLLLFVVCAHMNLFIFCYNNYVIFWYRQIEISKLNVKVVVSTQIQYRDIRDLTVEWITDYVTVVLTKIAVPNTLQAGSDYRMN